MASATFFNTPGSVENFLHWTGGLNEGERGFPPSSTNPAGIQITGEKEVMENLKRFMKEVPELVQGELALWAEKILAESREEVPVDMTYTTGKSHRLKGGTLMRSGTVEQSPDDANALRIGYNTPYAARQHEDMTYHHTKPGAKAKYLEDPAMRIAPQIIPGIVSAISQYFTTGVPNMSSMTAKQRISLGSLGGRYV